MQEGGLLERINRTLEQITIIQDNKKLPGWCEFGSDSGSKKGLWYCNCPPTKYKQPDVDDKGSGESVARFKCYTLEEWNAQDPKAKKAKPGKPGIYLE